MFDKAVSVVGLGYIGLPTATVLASRGAWVTGVDVNEEVVETINRGEIHLAEPDLDIAVRSVVTTGKLSATTKPRPADAFLIAVPTPFQENHEADLSYIEAASRSVARVLRSGNVVILESTAPVGATEKMCRWMAEERPELSFPDTRGEKADIRVAHCPERVLPGKVLRELVENDRVIGGITERCTEAAAAIYTMFVNGKLVHTDVRTAELCKLAENAYRDVNIAFANELSLLCDRYAIDVWELIELANRHPRVNILQPGAGVGGHCIAVDPWFIISQAPDLAKVMHTARSVNDAKPRFIVEQVKRQVAGRRDAVVACLGLTFKPDVDDLRESPALRIAETLADEGLNLIAVEPHIDTLPPSLAERPNVRLEPLAIAVEEADVLVGLVKHRALSEECRRRDFSGRDFLDYVNLFAH
jgi:UDP-N-acetyl-D-mannosaminuronic acid dehydrogenase